MEISSEFKMKMFMLLRILYKNFGGKSDGNVDECFKNIGVNSVETIDVFSKLNFQRFRHRRCSVTNIVPMIGM